MIANYHTHTYRCGHAEGDVGEYAEQAEKAVEPIEVAEVTTLVSFVHEEKVPFAMVVHAGRRTLVIPV